MYQNSIAYTNSDSYYYQEFINDFLSWTQTILQEPLNGDIFTILSDGKIICRIIFRIFPQSFDVPETILNDPNQNIENIYNLLCNSIQLAPASRITNDIIVRRDIHQLIFCLEEFIQAILRYRSPQEINVPSRLCCMTDSVSPSVVSHHMNMNQDEYPISIKDTVSVISTPNDIMSTSSTHSYYAAPEVSQPVLFNSYEQKMQNMSQKNFLQQLDSDNEAKIIAQKREEALRNQEKINKHQMQENQENACHHHNTNKPKVHDDIANEEISPIDVYQQKKEKKQRFWKKVGAVVGAIGAAAAVAITTAAVVADSKKKDDE